MIDADTCVQEIRDTVFRETSLTVSAGIAPNKVCLYLFFNEAAAYGCQMLAKVI
jgi:nucleotidyltransferase/DNA polymerase involved in DNA repair